MGYANGKANTNYKSVCRGDGNVEALAIVFDPAKISYHDLLLRFMRLHDPTQQKKRQYCSCIFPCDEEQDKMAQDLIKHEAENIQTRIETLERWTDAESRHQKYYEKKAAKKEAMRRFGQKL